MPHQLILILFIVLLSACQSNPNKESTMSQQQPPEAKKVPHTWSIHGDRRLDNYHWLRDDQRTDTDVLAYLTAENKYTESQLKDVEPLVDTLYQEITSRIKQNDESVPYRLDDFWYYKRFSEGQEYPIYARKQGSLDAEEQVLLDVNKLAKDYAYYASNNQQPSPNHKIYGFSEDTVSRRQYDLRFKDLATGKMLPDVIKNTTGSIAWAKDSETFFYTRKHPVTLLPYQVYRHRIGTPVSEDVLVYEEPDDTFYLSCYTSRSGDYIMIQIESTTQSEALYLDANNPTGEFSSVLPREDKHEYSVEDFNGDWIIVSNWQALNSRVMRVPIGDSQDKNKWQEIIPHDDETLIYDVEAFKDWLAVDQRRNGLKHIKVKNWSTGEEKIIQGDEAVSTMWVGFNPEQDTNTMRYSYDSFTQLGSVFEVELNSDEKTLLKQDEINGDYYPEQYQSERLLVTARDGVEVPVSLVYKKSDKDLSERPLLVYGYGSYGHSIDPGFSVSRLSLLDRGFVFAVAHIRGSQAKGRAWYEDGKMFNKMNTFTDFIDASKALLDKGYGDPARMYAWGGSAGGLLMGAVANMNGMLYDGMIASVPFVDVVTTMLDESLPLTTGEFEEWGNPKNQDAYEYMLSYSPYDQVKAQDYPNILVTTGLHDSQVQYFEPAKWVAKLRDYKTDDNLLLLRTNMETGHGGASGRFSYYKETAQDYAFLLKLAGIKS